MDPENIYSILNKAYFSENPHEAEVLKHMRKLLTICKLFVDVGASLGQFTKLANDYMDNGLIISVEADPIRFARLESNCNNWSKKGKNKIIPIHGAITEKKEIVRFQTTNSNISGGLYRHQIKETELNPVLTWNEIEVQGTTLDELCEGRVPDLIKMDIEGAELKALKGSQGILKSRKTFFVIELHSFEEVGGNKNIYQCKQYMKKSGYWNAPFYGKTIFFPSNFNNIKIFLKYHLFRVFKYFN